MSGQGLTEEQKKRIEENRQRALAKRAEKMSPVKPSRPTVQTNPVKVMPSVQRNTDPVQKGIQESKREDLQKNHVPTPSSNDTSVPISFKLHGEISPGCSAVISVEARTGHHNAPQPNNTSTKKTGNESQNYNNNNGMKIHAQESGSSTQFSSLSSQKSQSSGTLNSRANAFTSKESVSNTGAHSSATSSQHCPVLPKEKSFGTSQKLKGKCVLTNSTAFSVEVGYSAILIQYFKQMKTRSYDQSTKRWSFKVEEYNTFMKGLSNFKPDIEIEGLPRWILQTFYPSVKEVETVPEADLSCVDDKLVGTLLPFQRESVNLAIHRNGRLLIADDMGLGKTLQAICIAGYYRKEWPLLVVSPSSVRFDWAQQICKWLPSISPAYVNVVEKGSDSATSGWVNIISYDLLAKKAEELKEEKFKIIIMDESHFLKNSKTVRTRAAMPLLKNAKRVLLLSGTPALSRPNELFCQITSICPGLFKFHEFGLRYCNAKQQPWGWDYSGSSNMMELQILLEQKVMIRRQKKDVLTQLPEKTRQMVVLDPRSVQKHKDLKLTSKMMEKGNLKGMERRGALLQYFHETCKSKLSAVRDYIMDLLEADKKFLVFAHHREMLDCIEDCIKSQGSKAQYIRIDGSTGSEQRNYFCSTFQTSSEHRVAILSITAANAGLNLSAANVVVFAELFWNPGILVQAEDRAHRIGQKDSVSVQYLVAKGTADDYIWPLVQGKLNILSKAGLTKDDFSNADTRCMTDTQQSIMDMFSKDFIEETVPETAAAHVEEAASSGGSGQLVIEKLTPESNKQESSKNLASNASKRITPRKRPAGKSATPLKGQASITSFFVASPPKKPHIDESRPKKSLSQDSQIPSQKSLFLETPTSSRKSCSQDSQATPRGGSRATDVLDDLFGWDMDDEDIDNTENANTSTTRDELTNTTHRDNASDNTSPTISQEDLIAMQSLDWDEEM